MIENVAVNKPAAERPAGVRPAENGAVVKTHAKHDLVRRGDVDGVDFLAAQREPDPVAAVALWTSQYPSPLSAVSAVPEPTSGVMLLVTVLVV